MIPFLDRVVILCFQKLDWLGLSTTTSEQRRSFDCGSSHRHDVEISAQCVCCEEQVATTIHKTNWYLGWCVIATEKVLKWSCFPLLLFLLLHFVVVIVSSGQWSINNYRNHIVWTTLTTLLYIRGRKLPTTIYPHPTDILINWHSLPPPPTDIFRSHDRKWPPQ